MYIDSTSTNATIFVVAKNATGLRGYTMANCATAGAVAFTDPGANNVVNTATVGNAWVNLSKDASGNFHVVANDAATMVKYFNQSAASFATGAASSWTQPVTPFVETTGAAGIAAAGATRGGMVVDNTGDQILLTYGRTAAVTPTQTWANLVLAFNQCETGTGTCAATTLGSPSSSTTMTWGNVPLDTTGQTQKLLVQTPNTTIATTSTGTPAAAYVDYSLGGATDPIVGAKLRYAYRQGSTTSSNWSSSIIPTNSSPQSPSLKFDHNDIPWVAWFEQATGGLRYYLATNSRSDGSGVWSVVAFPTGDSVAATMPVFNHVALAMYYSAGVAKPYMIILKNAATKEVRGALYNPTTGSWSKHKQVMTLVGTTTPGGSYLSADNDTSGNIVMTVYDMGTGVAQTNCSPNTSRCIRFAYTSDGGTTWNLGSNGVIVNGSAEGLIVKMNPSTSAPAIAYFDRANNTGKYKYCSTALASCTTAGNWADVGVGLFDAAAGISGLVDNGATANYGLLNIGLTFTGDGLPWTVYPRGAGSTTANLMYSNVSTSGGTFGTPTSLATNSIGNITSPVAATAGNFGLSWNPQSVRSSVTGSLHTIYNGPGNFPTVTSCGN
jgi:hypothetical protein